MFTDSKQKKVAARTSKKRKDLASYQTQHLSDGKRPPHSLHYNRGPFYETARLQILLGKKESVGP